MIHFFALSLSTKFIVDFPLALSARALPPLSSVCAKDSSTIPSTTTSQKEKNSQHIAWDDLRQSIRLKTMKFFPLNLPSPIFVYLNYYWHFCHSPCSFFSWRVLSAHPWSCRSISVCVASLRVKQFLKYQFSLLSVLRRQNTIRLGIDTAQHPEIYSKGYDISSSSARLLV